MSDKRKPFLLLLLATLSASCFVVVLYQRWSSGEDARSFPLPAEKIPEALLNLPASIDYSSRVVLITGAAGFIGFHVSRQLIDQWSASVVVGLDIFSPYYDVRLKRDRASKLVELGVHMYQADLCHREFLMHLFAKYGFTHVVHMAAQAGVRHSLEEPAAYIRANVQCFTTLLDVLAEHKDTTLVFASSSSVYGHEANLPFTLDLPRQPPSNVYAASKTSSELFATSYCAQHGLKAVGLRLFTVYGPWGRPDMAVYTFAQSILDGEKVPFFNDQSGRRISRDFTFINDTVGGVMAALNHTPKKCGEVYNIGSGDPSPLATMLSLLEELLNKSAIIEPLPLPTSDLQSTFADISESVRVLGFQPRTSLKEGLAAFVSWLLDYRAKRKEEEEDGLERREEKDGLEMSSLELEQELGAGLQELEGVELANRQRRNSDYRQRIASLRQKFERHAVQNGRTLPKLDKSRFVYYPGIDSPGGTIIKAPGYRGNLKLLHARCLQTEQCIAFTTQGEFKNQLYKMEAINSSSQEGLYVADMDVCAADLDSCGAHSTCISTGPGTHSCSCATGYVRLGRMCVERYVEGVVSESEGAWQLSNQIGGLDWDHMTRNRPFVFFRGMDSLGGDYLVVEGGAVKGEGGEGVDRLQAACRATHRCLGFNTNGILKHSLQSPESWKYWTNDPYHGLYILDVDYCSLDIEQCPIDSQCVRHSPGNYSCSHDSRTKPNTDHLSPSVESEDGDGSELSDGGEGGESKIHVIVSVDGQHFPGVLAVLASSLEHCSQPAHLQFHVVVANGDAIALRQFLKCHGLFTSQVSMVTYEPNQLGVEVRVSSREETVGHLASPANFARFIFHSLLPHISRAIYLDADVVVNGDVLLLWKQLAATDQLLVAVPRMGTTYGSMFAVDTANELFEKRYEKRFSGSDPTFNAGVYGVNFDLWREQNIHAEVLYWMKEHALRPLWHLGTQPIMLLVAYQQWAWLDARWNVNGLGWNERMQEAELDDAYILHWNGRRKPWVADGLYRERWLPHVPRECKGRGTCRRSGYEYHCECLEGYSGDMCEVKGQTTGRKSLQTTDS